MCMARLKPTHDLSDHNSNTWWWIVLVEDQICILVLSYRNSYKLLQKVSEPPVEVEPETAPEESQPGMFV